MNGYDFDLAGARLSALPTGALFWAAEGCLAVSDLHLGRSERYARRAGALLPPYEVEDTLARLDADIAACRPRTVICLGDSFDDAEAAALDERAALWLARMMAGRRWIWIAGNHDPGPVTFAGELRAELALGPLVFRHEALPGAAGPGTAGEISGHFHPKASVATSARRISGRCFVTDGRRIVLPALGAYAGGLDVLDPAIAGLMRRRFTVFLLGRDRLFAFPREQLQRIAA